MFYNICEYCGKEFGIYFENQRFCSRECYQKFGKEIGKYGRMNCPVCGKEFKKLRPSHTYCSRECRAMSDRKRVVFKCEVCGKEASRIMSEYNKREHHFCSRECKKAGLGWNEEDTKLLRDNFGKMKYSEMIGLFSEPKSTRQICARAIYIGLTSPRDWSEEELTILRDSYSIKSMDEMLFLLPNRSLHSILGQARRQKLYSYFYLSNQYTDEEEKFLRDNYLTKSNKELGDILGRPEHGIEQHLNLLDLHRPMEIDKYKDVKRYIRARLTPWRDKYRRDHNYTCELTGSNSNIIVHHIRSFGLILSEAIENLDFPIYEDMSKYTEEQLDELFDEYMYLQEYYGQYICIKEDIHIHFHSIYGFGGNTIEQWDEFINTYYKQTA